MNLIHVFRYLTESFYVRVLTIRTGISLRVQESRRAKHKQHWQAGSIGGGAVVQLGFLTEREALEKLQYIKGDDEPIAYVDFERGFIAYGKHPEAVTKK